MPRLLGHAGQTAFGLTGATLLFLALVAGGFTLFTGLSWLGLAEAIGGWAEWALRTGIANLRAWRDRRAGAIASTEREVTVVEARKLILDLLLSAHPMACITCEQSGGCTLQEYCYRYGVEASTFEGDKRMLPIESDNPMIERDMNKCILCGKCVRVCEEIQVTGAIDFTERGFDCFPGWVADTARLLRGCPCTSGCPSCVQSPKCGNLNEMLDKEAALLLLERMSST